MKIKHGLAAILAAAVVCLAGALGSEAQAAPEPPAQANAVMASIPTFICYVWPPFCW